MARYCSRAKAEFKTAYNSDSDDETKEQGGGVIIHSGSPSESAHISLSHWINCFKGHHMSVTEGLKNHLDRRQGDTLDSKEATTDGVLE